MDVMEEEVPRFPLCIANNQLPLAKLKRLTLNNACVGQAMRMLICKHLSTLEDIKLVHCFTSVRLYGIPNHRTWAVLFLAITERASVPLRSFVIEYHGDEQDHDHVRLTYIDSYGEDVGELPSHSSPTADFAAYDKLQDYIKSNVARLDGIAASKVDEE